MRRRDFLRATLASAGVLAGRGVYASWGSAPDAVSQALLLGPGERASGILEIFLYGGLGPFESFYVVESSGHPTQSAYPGEQFYLFAEEHEAVFGGCGAASPWLVPLGVDSAGQTVSLGPLAAPLSARSDILARLRVLVQRHDLEPHEAAIPYALSGHRLGSARLSGLGAAVQRHCVARESSPRQTPYSYVLYPETEISTDNLRAASALGLHPGLARPLGLRISSDMSALERSLQRANVGSRRDAYDALLAHYVSSVSSRHAGLVAPGLGDYARASASVQGADALRSVLSSEALAAVQGAACGAEAFSTVATGMQLAVHLLTHPTSPARHVTVVDGGLVPASGGGGYDVHTGHLVETARNLTHTLQVLADHIRRPGAGGADAGLLDLDETLVIIHTEFGRTPYRQAYSSDGTNHHPYGYATAMLGGPVAPGVLGAIEADGVARSYVTPTEARAAALAAMGIYPFTNSTFAVGDLRGVSTERDGLAWLNEIVLGRG